MPRRDLRRAARAQLDAWLEEAQAALNTADPVAAQRALRRADRRLAAAIRPRTTKQPRTR